MNNNTTILTCVSAVALAGTTLYWRRRERTVRESLTMSRDWEANTTSREEREDQEDRRAAREAADHLNAKIRDLPERVTTLDEERRHLNRELDAVRERWADLWWTSQADEALARGEANSDDPTVRVIEFDSGEFSDAQAFADRAMNENGITLVAAHGDNSFAVAVGEALADEFSAEDIACEIADEAGGGAGGNARFASGGGAMDGLSEGCWRVQENLVQSDSVSVA